MEIQNKDLNNSDKNTDFLEQDFNKVINFYANEVKKLPGVRLRLFVGRYLYKTVFFLFYLVFLFLFLHRSLFSGCLFALVSVVNFTAHKFLSRIFVKNMPYRNMIVCLFAVSANVAAVCSLTKLWMMLQNMSIQLPVFFFYMVIFLLSCIVFGFIGPGKKKWEDIVILQMFSHDIQHLIKMQDGETETGKTFEQKK